jgi:hypothetical protein
MSVAAGPRDRDGSQAVFVVLFFIELIAIVLLSQLVVESSLPSACDEPASSYSADRLSGCDFLEGGGYHVIRMLPSLLLGAFAWLAYRRRRITLLVGGFAVAFAFLVCALLVSPSHYFWA